MGEFEEEGFEEMEFEGVLRVEEGLLRQVTGGIIIEFDRAKEGEEGMLFVGNFKGFTSG